MENTNEEKNFSDVLGGFFSRTQKFWIVFLILLVVAAVAVGVDGLFIETHPNPEAAKSDSAVMIPLNNMKPLLQQLQKIYFAIQ